MDIPRDRLWSWVSGRNIILDREGIGMARPTGVEVAADGVEEVEEVVVAEEGGIDQSAELRVG